MTQPPDIHTLTGAYALDALPDDERELFEHHLEVCDACAQEVAELQATAARLGAASVVPPSRELRDRVLAEIDRTRQEPPRPLTAPDATDDRVVPLPAATRMPRWLLAAVAPAAAILLVAVVALSMMVGDLNQRLDELSVASGQLEELLAAPDAVTISAQGPDGSIARIVASPARGEAVFVAAAMEPAPEAHTYELWLIHADGRALPAGLFEVDERGRATSVLTGDMSDMVAVGVTVEPEGGSPEPTTDPVMVVPLEG